MNTKYFTAILLVLMLVSSVLVLADAPELTAEYGSSELADGDTISVDQDDLIEISFSATDADGDGMSYSIVDVCDDCYDVPTFDEATHFTDNGDGTADLIWTVENDDVGSHEFTVTVTDDSTAEEFVEFVFYVEVTNVNDAPVLDTIGDQTADEDTEFTLDIVVEDVDLNVDSTEVITIEVEEESSDCLDSTLDLTDADIFVDNGDGTAAITWTPTNDDVGDHDILVTVTDNDGEYDTEALTITVDNVNDAPVLDSVGDQEVDEDSLFSFEFSADDDDLDLDSTTEVLEISITEDDYDSDDSTLDLTDASIFVDNGDGTATLAWIPIKDDIGNHEITVTVTDADGEEDGETFTLTVVEVNDAPILASVSNEIVLQDESVEIEFSAIDEEDGADGLVLSLLATEEDYDSPSSTLDLTDSDIFVDNGDGTATLTWTPDNYDVGDHEITVTATDSGGETGEVTFTITVVNVYDAPTLDPIADQTAYLDAATTIGIEFSLDLMAEELVEDIDLEVDSDEALSFDINFYNSDDGSAPTQDFEIDSDGVITWTADENELGYTFTVQVSVEDAYGLTSDTVSFDVTVEETNRPTLENLDASYDATEDEQFSLTFEASDADSDNIEVTADDGSFRGDYSTASTFDSDYEIVDNDDGTFTLTWTPTNDDVGDHTITVTVSDGVLDEEDTFTLTVENVNDAPVVGSIDSGDLDATEDEQFTLTITVSDPEGDDIEVVDWDVDCDGDCRSSSLDLDDSDIFVDNGDGTFTITWTPDSDDAQGDVDHDVTITFADENGAEDDVDFTISVSEVATDEEQPVIDLENDFDDFVDEFNDIEDALDDACDDDDENDIEDLENDLDALDDDLADLDDEIDDLQNEIDDNDDLDSDEKDDLLDRLDDLESDVVSLREDINDLLDDSCPSSSSRSSTDGESANEYSSSSSTSTSADGEDPEVIVTTFTTPQSNSGTSSAGETVTYEVSEVSSWDQLRVIAWLLAGIAIVFALLVFMISLLVSSNRKSRE